MARKWFHALIAIALLACLVSPYVEMAFNSNDLALLAGRDTESTIAVLLLVLELAFALAGLLVILAPGIFERVRLASPHGRLTAPPGLAILPPELSPPLPLRI